MPGGTSPGTTAWGKKRRTDKTKTSITFATGLRFRWTWARFEANNKLYKIMQWNIIVQQGRIKPNDERFDLSLKDKPVKPPKSKRKRIFIRNPFLMSLSLSWRWTQGLNPHIDKSQITTKKYDSNDAKVWALSERYDEGTHTRAPLDSTAIYPITRSPN